MSKLLVIDDHPAICLALKSYIEQVSAHRVVASAASGREALSGIRLHRPDLVILDLVLADSDGLELIRSIRACDAKVVVLVLSAREEQIYINRAEELGASGYVFKSRPLEDLMRALQMVLAGYQCFPLHNLPRSSEIRHAGLTRRELAVLGHIGRGSRNKDIAMQLFISPKTVSTYKMRLLDKLKLKTTLDLAEYARRSGLF
jgi:DNA-binding NarL/FixJ family response regulator